MCLKACSVTFNCAYLMCKAKLPYGFPLVLHNGHSETLLSQISVRQSAEWSIVQGCSRPDFFYQIHIPRAQQEQTRYNFPCCFFLFHSSPSLPLPFSSGCKGDDGVARDVTVGGAAMLFSKTEPHFWLLRNKEIEQASPPNFSSCWTVIWLLLLLSSTYSDFNVSL